MDITHLLKMAEAGDTAASEALYQAVYQQLHGLALRHRGNWRGDETLNTTALVNEAWLKLADGQTPEWEGRGHFFAVASRVMRQILVDKARQRCSLKRGANALHSDSVESEAAPEVFSTELAGEVLRVHDALEKLASTHPRQARVVECRFFGGMQVNETSEALEISISTVRRDWELAKLWLYRELGD
jgi:RNA polymerase sigma factor (TIGR02999 family)